MPQLVKKRRSGWAVLAAGALIASILAVGANPAAAEARNADGVAKWRACLGPAMADRDPPFTDIGGNVHSDNINCLAYYGITRGKTPESYAPDSNVTRSQMALFLARAAKLAGIDLDGAIMYKGFTDLNADDIERVEAIERLVGLGIMFGDTNTSFDPPSTTHFEPAEPVTRWEMAMFLFAFLDQALESVLIDELPDGLEGNNDGVGGLEHSDDNGDGIGTAVDDYFRDARRETPAHVDARIGAIYELGITTGVNNEVGEQGRFEPNGLVTRGQMASFIMRALGHTNLRPEGVTAQYVGEDTQVSVRGPAPDFDPVVDKRVEVFYTHFEEPAFDSAGECVEVYVGTYEEIPGKACEIGRGDVETNDYGNVIIENNRAVNNVLTLNCTAGAGGTYTLAIDKPSSVAAFQSWAWQGELYDEVDSDTKRFKVVKGRAPGDVSPAPTHAVVTGGDTNHYKMGDVIEYTIQLSSANPNAGAANEPAYVDASPVLGEQYGFEVIVRTHQQASDKISKDRTDWSLYTEDFPFKIFLNDTERTRVLGTFSPNSDGEITVPVLIRDPVRGGLDRDNRDVQVQIQVSPVAGNELGLVDDTKGEKITTADVGWVTAIVSETLSLSSHASRVSDNDPHPAAVKVKPEQDLRVLAVTKQAYVSMTVTDQYGDPFTPWLKNDDAKRTARQKAYTVNVNPASDRNEDGTDERKDGVERPVRARGKATHNYVYGGPGGNGDSNTPSVEIVRITASLIDLKTDKLEEKKDIIARVYWAGTGTKVDQRTAGPRVYLADTGQKLIAVQEVQEKDKGQPMVYEYGVDDNFTVEGRVVSFAQFEQVISSMKLLAGTDDENYTQQENALLEWDDYRRHGLSRRPSTDADWRLSNLNCPEPSS